MKMQLKTLNNAFKKVKQVHFLLKSDRVRLQRRFASALKVDESYALVDMQLHLASLIHEGQKLGSDGDERINLRVEALRQALVLNTHVLRRRVKDNRKEFCDLVQRFRKERKMWRLIENLTWRDFASV